MGTSVVEWDDLPEPIIQHIISFLTAEEAAQTTLLSTSWRSALLTRPNLAFQQDYRRPACDSATRTKINPVLELARKTIQRYEESNLRIQSLTLRVGAVGNNNNIVRVDEIDVPNELIAKSLKLGATHFNLTINYYKFVLRHDIVFGSEKLVGLSLGCCKIEISEQKVIRCSGLESLSLSSMQISPDTLSNIISSCPSIQKLSLYNVNVGGVGVNRFVGLMNLRSLTRLELELVSVKFDNLFFGDVSSTSCLCLEYLYLNCTDISLDTLSNIISSCPSIRKLSLSSIYGGVEDIVIRSVGLGPMNLHSLTRLELVKVYFDTLFLVGDLSSRFPSLKDLTLHTCSSTITSHSNFSQNQEIWISSRSLERLNYAQEKGCRVRLKLDVPSIRRFTYEGEDIPLLSIKKSTSREWESRVSIMCHKKLGSLWFRKLNKFLTKLRRSEIHLSLDVSCWTSFDYEAGEIHGSCSRRPRVENLTIDVGHLPTMNCYAFFDGLFLLCRPKFITQCFCRHDEGKNQYFLWKTLVERVGNEEKCCSGHDHFMYHGLRDLEEVNLAIFDKADSGGVWRDVPLESLLDEITLPVFTWAPPQMCLGGSPLDDDELKAELEAAPDEEDDIDEPDYEYGMLVEEEVKVRFQLKWKR